jgi:hypothetical protein
MKRMLFNATQAEELRVATWIGDRFGAGLPGWFGHEKPSKMDRQSDLIEAAKNAPPTINLCHENSWAHRAK